MQRNGARLLVLAGLLFVGLGANIAAESLLRAGSPLPAEGVGVLGVLAGLCVVGAGVVELRSGS